MTSILFQNFTCMYCGSGFIEDRSIHTTSQIQMEDPIPSAGITIEDSKIQNMDQKSENVCINNVEDSLIQKVDKSGQVSIAEDSIIQNIDFAGITIKDCQIQKVDNSEQVSIQDNSKIQKVDLSGQVSIEDSKIQKEDSIFRISKIQKVDMSGRVSIVDYSNIQKKISIIPTIEDSKIQKAHRLQQMLKMSMQHDLSIEDSKIQNEDFICSTFEDSKTQKVDFSIEESKIQKVDSFISEDSKILKEDNPKIPKKNTNLSTITLNMDSSKFSKIPLAVGCLDGEIGIYVSRIGQFFTDGHLDMDCQINPGDKILQVNEISFANMSYDEVAKILKDVPQKPGPIRLVVGKSQKESSESVSSKYDYDISPYISSEHKEESKNNESLYSKYDSEDESVESEDNSQDESSSHFLIPDSKDESVDESVPELETDSEDESVPELETDSEDESEDGSLQYYVQPVEDAVMDDIINRFDKLTRDPGPPPGFEGCGFNENKFVAKDYFQKDESAESQDESVESQDESAESQDESVDSEDESVESQDESAESQDESVDSEEDENDSSVILGDDEQQEWINDLQNRRCKMAQALYSRTANNEQELNVVRGEILEVIDDSRNWWNTKNSRGEFGYVPYTIMVGLSEFHINDITYSNAESDTNSNTDSETDSNEESISNGQDYDQTLEKFKLEKTTMEILLGDLAIENQNLKEENRSLKENSENQGSMSVYDFLFQIMGLLMIAIILFCA